MGGNLVRHLAALAGVALLLVGCLDSKAVLTVNPDGSGTLEHTLYVKQQKEQGAKELTLDEMKANCEKTASSLGEGVKVASVSAAEARAGWKGFKILYTFADVAKVKVGYLPAMGDMKTEAKDLMSFEFKGGAQPVLTIVRPPLSVGDDKEGQKEDDDPQIAAAFEGAKIEFEVRVKGTITKTNAENVTADKAGVVLLREDIGGLLKDKQALAIAKALGKIKDAQALRAKLKDTALAKYVQMEPEPIVTIEFK